MGKVVKNISWTFLSTIIVSLIQVIQLGILAHHVPIQDMGILSLIFSIINIVVIFQDVGFSSFLIYKQDVKEAQRHCLFTLNITMGITLFVLAVLISQPLGAWFSLEKFSPLFSLASLNFIFMAAGSQAQALCIKEKKLAFLAQLEIASKLLSFLIMVSLLWYGYGITSQIVALLGGTLFFSAILLWKNKYSMRFRFAWAEIREPLSYGGYHLGSIFIGELRKQMDVLIAAKFLGGETLGLYTVAKELALKSIVIVRPIMVKVAMPIFAEKQAVVDTLRETYLKTNRYISYLYGLMAILSIIFSYQIIYTIYGEKYTSAQSIFIIFLMVCFLRCIGLPLGILAQAVGKTSIEFKWNIISTTLFILCMFITAVWNVDYLAQSVLGAQIILTFLSRNLFLEKFFVLDFYSFIKSWGGPFLILIITAVFVTAL